MPKRTPPILAATGVPDSLEREGKRRRKRLRRERQHETDR
jgi:hypothetical protein